MYDICDIAPKNVSTRRLLNKTEKYSLLYHNIFDYPLTFADMIKWNTSENVVAKTLNMPIEYRDGYFFLKGRSGLIYKRVFRSRISDKKMEIAKKASRILSMIPSVKMVSVTGSLAMKNASEESDIDLFLITRKNFLWSTRALSYILLKFFGLKVRRAGNKGQKDMLCLNMWLDETDLIWKKKDRNIYTAHEIAQITPLVNRDKTYERFLRCNRWILDFWPNAIKIVNSDSRIANSQVWTTIFEKIAYKIQLNHMKSRITKEKVSSTRAVFHPHDWGKVVISRLGS
jgi:predicted nucleotidyltransferase